MLLQTEILRLRQELAQTKLAHQQTTALAEQQRLEITRLQQELHDVQRQKVQYESAEKYRSIIENMELGLLEVDLQGQIIKAYPRFCEMLGYEMDELTGKNAIEILLLPEYLPVLEQQSKDREAGKAGVYEIQILHKNGSRVWVLISGAPFFDLQGNLVGTIGIHYDITKQKNLQHDLEIARQRAEDSQRAEQQFLANMSHEIRTPLNAIIGMSHLLNDTDLSREQNEYLEVLQSSANILYSLISDLLDITKIQAGKLEIVEQEFHLPSLIKSMQRTIQGKVLNKPVEVSATVAASLGTLLRGDDLLLNQILLNILGNATKFTEEGFISLKVNLIHKKGSLVTIEFSVTDTGIGIPEDKLDLIFQSFRQVDGDIKRKFGGTGLGLTIVKQLVEAQGGTIAVESALGKGTRFVITLTYEDTGKTYQEEKIKVSEAVEKEQWIYDRVLIVEDNFMNQKYISSLLKKWNIAYDIAFNGREGFEMAQQRKYDLIFMDIQMPEMDGYECATAIRIYPNLNEKTMIVALTASAMLSHRDLAFERGMNDYLSKPFKPNELAMILKKYAPQKIAISQENTPLSTLPEKDTKTNNEATNAKSKPIKMVKHAHLNRAYLEEVYEGDYEYAFEMFEIFLDKMENEYKPLVTNIEAKNWKEASSLAHKLKPAFPMVGLTWLQPEVQTLEALLRAQTPNEAAILAQFEQIKAMVEADLHLVETEFEQLKKLVS
jgi:PAS domain S-box-containing protein